MPVRTPFESVKPASRSTPLSPLTISCQWDIDQVEGGHLKEADLFVSVPLGIELCLEWVLTAAYDRLFGLEYKLPTCFRNL